MILIGSTFFILQPSLSRLGAAECGWASPPFAEEEEVNPFANPGGVPPASNTRLSPLPPEPVGFDYGRTVDIPLDRPGTQDLKKKEKKLQAKEAELRRREQMGSEQLWLSWG